ncbi:MAG: hypothetical protein GX202_03770 [Firmicutes bacterium]|nr:hypothetical protein [Bacillota bacterium]
MAEKREEVSPVNQTVRIINTVKTFTVKSKDPYVLKAVERAKTQLRNHLLELGEN